MTLRVDRLTPSRIEFDLMGIDASIANALRRICIAEVSPDRGRQVLLEAETSS
jgi:DNA-directed RNA polymerase I and III subunit RPAC1